MLSPWHLGASASPSPTGVDDKGPPVNIDTGIAQCPMYSLSIAPQLLSSDSWPSVRRTLVIRSITLRSGPSSEQSHPGRRLGLEPWQAVWSRLFWSPWVSLRWPTDQWCYLCDLQRVCYHTWAMPYLSLHSPKPWAPGCVHGTSLTQQVSCSLRV